jgi:hypothetical protein
MPVCGQHDLARVGQLLDGDPVRPLVKGQQLAGNKIVPAPDPTTEVIEQA